MKTLYRGIFNLNLAFAAVFLLLMPTGCSRAPQRACFGGACFELEVARTQEQRSQGLMFRESLEADEAMLFIFEKEDVYCFWMKNTLLPLDIIWLDANKEVVYIAENVHPCRRDPCPNTCPDKPAKYAIELNAGTCKDLGLRAGDSFILE